MRGGLGVNSSWCLSFIFSMQALEEQTAAVCACVPHAGADGCSAGYRDTASSFSLSISARAWVSWS